MLAWRLRILAARARRRLAGAHPDREDVVRELAAGHSFLDVGCMWKVHGRIAFVAEEAGATKITGIDVIPASEEFEAERKRRDSKVHFIQEDLHDRGVVEAHEIVFCSGVLYHSPYPILTLRRLRELTTGLLILQTMTIPELPGARQGLVFYPGLAERQRRLYHRWGEEARAGLADPRAAAVEYDPWWWGISRSALRAMLRTEGFEPEREWGDPFGVHIVARPIL